MYVSTYKAIVTFISLALLSIWGTILAVTLIPDKPIQPAKDKTYIDLYKECMHGRYDTSADVCEELTIKQMEKQDERTSTEDNRTIEDTSTGNSEEQ